MSQLRPPSSGTDVCHVNALSEHLGTLCLNPDYSDIKLQIEGKTIPGHKIILAARSEYFRALLFGGMRESTQDVIPLEVGSLPAFELLLKYIYSGRMNLAQLKEEQILEILGLAHQYGFCELESSVSEFLKGILNICNVCLIYNNAHLFQLDSLATVCCSFVDQNALGLLHHDSFLQLSARALKDMISRDSFCAPEVDIFRAVCNWAEHNPGESLSDILCAVRLPLMTDGDLLHVVRPTGRISPDDILDALTAKLNCRDSNLNYRGHLLEEENVAVSKLNAQVLKGEVRSALLDGDTTSYDMEKGYTRHSIDENEGKGIVVMLGMPCIVNHMRLLLWDKDLRSYSYYIEVSVDQKDWVRIVDYSQYYCRSWQHIYFTPRVVKYIRIVGTHNTVNRVFHVVTFECMFTRKSFYTENGIIAPKHNVATPEWHSCVIEGVSRSRYALINGNTEDYDWDSGYTCHQLGSGAIVVQLAQPYILESMRFLLWDCDARSYGYYVEVSCDQQQWNVVADKQEEACRSWQVIKFPRRPVVFIRIVGTRNTANEVFHCVHFECPSQEESTNKQLEKN